MTTKKLLRNIALLLLPVLLYYAVFLAFEPNNYFGLRSETPSGAVFGAVHEFERRPASTVILGDSRTAHLDMDFVEELAGREVSNLSFGGASLTEQLDMLDWLLDGGYEIDQIVFAISFYTLNENYGQDRWEGIESALQNPFLYLTNFSFNVETLQNVWFWVQGLPLGGGEEETEDPADYKYAEYTFPLPVFSSALPKTATLRTTVGDHMENMLPYIQKWELNGTAVERLAETIERCVAEGIDFVVVLPPMHPAVRELFVEAYSIDGQVLAALDSLRASGAQVLDYEFANAPDYREDQYYDGLHLDYLRGLPVWTQTLVGDIDAAA